MPNGDKPCRIMIVDDDPTSLLLAQEVVKFMGAEPVPHSRGDAALKALDEAAVDLIFMDVHMPGMSGLDVTRKVRQMEYDRGLRRTPIIALTASSMPMELAACLERGMDDVMTKPVSLDTIRRALQKWCPPD